MRPLNIYKIWHVEYKEIQLMDQLREFLLQMARNLGDKEKALDAYSYTHTDNFKNWFGDWINNPESASKVVDENGEPLMAYHGTDADFTTFDKNKSINSTYNGIAFTVDMIDNNPDWWTNND